MASDRPAALGFKADEAERAMAIINAGARPDDLDVAMDLARYVRIPLADAAYALIGGDRALRRLGTSEATVRADTAGMAAMYATTFSGQMEVREAQGRTFSKVFTDTIERWFGKR